MALDKLTKLTSQSGITTTIDYQMSDLTVDTITVQSGGIKMPVGMSTFQNVTVTGDLTVNGTTTTLDTDLIGVDKLEVSGSNTTAVGIITQAGSGDILRLYDSTTEVFKVADGGNVTTSGSVGIADSIIHVGNTDTSIRFPADDTFTVETAGSEKLRITSIGTVGINTTSSGGDGLGIMVDNNSTNALATGSIGLVLKNKSSTDNSWVSMDFNNSAGGIVGRFGAQFKDTSDKDTDLYFATRADGGNLTEALRITSDRKVGINRTSPVRHLHAYAPGAGFVAKFEGAYSYSSVEFADSGTTNAPYIGSKNDHFTIATGGNNERLRITSAGKVGINSAIPSDLLSIGAGANTLAFGAKDTIRGNHVWQLLNNDNAGNAEFRMYKNSVTGTHAQSINFATSGDANYILDGNFGIGLNNPTSILHLSGSAPRITLTDTAGTDDYAKIFSTGGALYFQQRDSSAHGNIVFRTENNSGASEKLRIRATGQVEFKNGSFSDNVDCVMGNGGELTLGAQSSIKFRTATNQVLFIDSNGLISNRNRAPSDYGSPQLLIGGGSSTLTMMGDGSTNNSSYTGIKFRVAGGSTGDYTKAGIFAQRQGGYNDLALIFAMDTVADASSVAIADEKVRITSAGNVGIGSAIPAGKLDISHDTQTNLLVLKRHSGNSGVFRIGIGGAIPGVELTAEGISDDFIFRPGGTEKVRFTAGGHVGIGTDAPAGGSSLHINGGAASDKPHIRLTADRGLIARLGDTSGGAQAMFDLYGTDGSTQILRFISGGSTNWINTGGPVIFGHNSSPTSDGDPIQVVSTSGGQGINIFNYSASAYGNQIAFMKSRHGTIGGNTILNTGDRIGELNFYGNDGTNRSLGAQISVRVDASPGNDNTPSAIYLMTGTDQSMQTRLSVKSNGCVGVSKNGWSTSDNSFAFTVHTGSTSDSGDPVNDGIMIVSQNSSGNQNSTTGKLMFCGHAQVNGPFLYADNTQAYGKKDLVFHTRSTANDYTTQVAETLRLTKWGHFGLGTETNIDSLMHIQGNSDNGDNYCQLTIEDTDSTSGSRVPSIQFKGDGTDTWRIRGTDLSGLQFHQWNGSAQVERAIIGNPDEAGAFLLNADDRGWATLRWNHNTGMRTHVRVLHSPGNAVATYTILRIRRHNWGWGNYKIRLKEIYYTGSYETTYMINGHGVNGDYYHVHKETFGGDASSNDWSACTITETASSSSPGSSGTWMTDIKINIPNYRYAIIYIEAWGGGYSTDPTSMTTNSYCLM